MVFGELLFLGKLGLSAYQSYSAGQSKRNAAIASNKETKRLNKAQFKRDKEVTEIDFLNALTGHAFKLAENAGLRYKDDIKKADFDKQQSSIINAALQNLGLNTDELTDQYVVAEDIRYNDEMRDLLYQTGKLGMSREGQQLENGLGRQGSQQQFKGSSQTSKMNTRQSVSTAKGLYSLNKGINNTVYGDRINKVENNRDFQLGREDLSAEIATNAANQAFKTNITNNNIAAAQSNKQAMDAVAQYMNRITGNKLQADAILSRKEDEGAVIQEQIVIGEAIDTMARDAEYLAAMGESATRKAIATARTGGSKSAAKASLDVMQRMGRTYGLMRAEQDKRRQAMTRYNASVVGETAQQFAILANQSDGYAKNISSTNDLNSLRNEGFTNTDASLRAGNALDLLSIGAQRDQNKYGITQDATDQIQGLVNARDSSNAQGKFNRDTAIQGSRLTNKLNQVGYKATNKLNKYGLRKGNQLKRGEYKFDMNYQLQTFNNSTIPGFGLAQNAGQRAMNALYQNTYNAINQASTPFREAIIIDPPEPIAGLAPELKESAKVYVPSSGSILRDTFASTAMEALDSARTKPDGSTGFW